MEPDSKVKQTTTGDVTDAVKTFNLNDRITVTLTERGAKMLNEREHIRPNKMWKSGDEYTDQAWQIFQFFGKEFGMGMDLVIQTEIKIP